MNHYKYLGVTLKTQGKIFTWHIKDKVVSATKAMRDISNLREMSLKSAMRFFRANIIPIVTYGLEFNWENLNKRNLGDFEKVKAIFFKKVLCISKYI